VFENALALTGFAEFLGLRLRVLHLLSGGNNIGGEIRLSGVFGGGLLLDKR
jgi:hypothetical protein